MDPDQVAIALSAALFIAIPCAICGLLAAAIGARKNAAVAGLLLGFLLGPIGILLALLLDGRPKCPNCLERLQPRARVCWRCRVRLVWRTGNVPMAVRGP